RWRKPAAGWLLFAAALATFLSPYPFHALRNFLPLVPLACILIALLYAQLRHLAARQASMGAMGAVEAVGAVGAPSGAAEATAATGTAATSATTETTGKTGKTGTAEATGATGAKGTTRAALIADLAILALPLILFGPALHEYVGHQATLVDSRATAIRWLTAHTAADDRVLFADSLAFHPGQVATLGMRTGIAPWPALRSLLRRRRWDYAVLGDLSLPGPRFLSRAEWQEILDGYQLVVAFGEQPAPEGGAIFHGNRQKIYILKLK
ncbi:MAG: hypothetical protein M3O15_05255, partial [Acidobacteriota bacterium]|nr:hypothetical protein [Acidobacteriota bacterium]